jgi:hypothetical protein
MFCFILLAVNGAPPNQGRGKSNDLSPGHREKCPSGAIEVCRTRVLG